MIFNHPDMCQKVYAEAEALTVGCPYLAIEKNPSRFELFILEINSFPCTIQVFFLISLFTVMKSDLSHKMKVVNSE